MCFIFHDFIDLLIVMKWYWRVVVSGALGYCQHPTEERSILTSIIKEKNVASWVAKYKGSEYKCIPPHGEVYFAVCCSTLGQRNLWPEEFSHTHYHLLKHWM